MCLHAAVRGECRVYIERTGEVSETCLDICSSRPGSFREYLFELRVPRSSFELACQSQRLLEYE